MTEKLKKEVIFNKHSFAAIGAISSSKGFCLDAMEEYAKPYKEIAELISSIFFYGNFVAETPKEVQLEKKLMEVGLWPTTEDEILKRSEK